MPSPFVRLRVIALLVVACVVCLATTPASAIELEEVLAHFDRVQQAIQTLTAEFTETTQSALLKEDIAGEGKVYLTKPDSVRWEYTVPEPMRFVISDDQYTGYFPERKQAEKRDVHRWGEQLFRFLGLGQGSDELAKFYNISIDTDATNEREIVLVLDPKKKRVRKRMESVRFWISAETYLPVRVRYSSRNGNTRLIEFLRVDVNPPIETSVYVVDLPADVEITKGFSALSGFGKDDSTN